MKHIFIIQSSITYYISLAVINYKQLNPLDVIFISTRHYNPNNQSYIIYDCLEWLDWYYPLSIKKLARHYGNLHKIDDRIFSITNNEEYYAYIPNTDSPLNQIVITNDLCKKYAIIEEGVANYRDYLYTRPSFVRPKIIILACYFLNYFLKRIYLYHPFLGEYRKSNLKPQYFYFKSDKNIITERDNHVYLPFYKEQYCREYDYSRCNLFVLSSLRNKIHQDNQLPLLLYISDKLIGVENLYIKYHPAQDDTFKREFERILNAKSITYSVMDNNLSIEQVIVNSRNLTLYGFDSSALFYSKILNPNIKVYSFSKYLSNIDSLYNDIYSEIQYLYEDVIQL